MSKAQKLADSQSEAQMIAGWLESGGGHGVPSMHALRAARELRRLDRVNAEQRKALQFYANISDYKAPFTGGAGKLWLDCGETARAALSSSGGTES